MTREPEQEAVAREVRSWEGGQWRDEFGDAAELRDEVVRALHDLELAASAGPVDRDAIRSRAEGLVEQELRGKQSGDAALVITGGPLQPLLRPAQLEDPALADALQKEAIFGAARL